MTYHGPVMPAVDYDAALNALVPGIEPEEVRTIRRRLLRARDLASQALCRPQDHSRDAADLYALAVRVSAAHAFRNAPLQTLEDAATICVRSFQLAAALHRLEAGDGVD